MKKLSKLILLVAASSLIVACQTQAQVSEPQSNNSVPESSIILASSQESSKPISSSNDVSSSSDVKPSSSNDVSSISSNKVSSSSDKSSSSSVKPSSSNAPSSSTPSSFSSIELSNNPQTCDNHVLTDTIKKEASLLEPGIKHLECANCGGFTEEYIYKLDEFTFTNATYQYDGGERELLIKGVLPYGVTVQYENNKLTNIGQKEATAKIYGPNNELLMSKTATLSIVEKIGLANIRVTTEDEEDPDWHTYDGQRLYKNMTVSIDNALDSKYNISSAPGEIKVRGNSTNQESVAKRAFRLKLSSKTNLLGLNDGLKEKSWVLLADFFDQSRFRNSSAFIMGDSLFNYSGLYSSDHQHVKLYMNGEDRGVYLLAEQQQAKKGRIPINEAKSDYTGTDIGYLIEIDGLVTQQNKVDSQTHIGVSEGDPCFTTGTGTSSGWGGWGGWGQQSGDQINGVTIQDKGYVVKTDTYGDDQVPFIRDYMNNVLTAFKGTLKGEKKQIVDETGALVDSPYESMYDTLNSYIDLDSFFRMYVLQEYLKDYDVGWGSFYMYVDFSKNSTVKRLTMAAPWDFDLGEGNKTSGDIAKANDDFLNKSSYANGMTTANPWLYMLSQTDFFQTMFKKYYSIFNSSQIYEKMIDEIAYERVAFASDFDDNHTRYGKGASGATLMQTRQYNSHQEAVDYLVKWFGDRKEYLDNKYLK